MLRQCKHILVISTLLFQLFASAKSTLDQITETRIEKAVNQAIISQQIPGAVICIGLNNTIIYKKAFGSKSISENLPHSLMTVDTIFDIASLTKTCTALAIILLAERGHLYLKAPVVTYLPEFGQNGKEKITIEQLLLHTSGLPATNGLFDYSRGKNTALNAIYALPISSEQAYCYSDVGYILLGELIEKVSGKRLDIFMHENIFKPLNMHTTFFNPSIEHHYRIAPTEIRNAKLIQGEVHDPRAYLLGGVAGHAGLFSTVEDLALFCMMLVNRGTYKGIEIASPQSITRMTKMHMLPNGKIRGLGLDISTEHSTFMGDFFPLGTFGHTGFTGTSFFIEPQSKIFVIVLTNRVHLKNGNAIHLRAHLANIISSILV